MTRYVVMVGKMFISSGSSTGFYHLSEGYANGSHRFLDRAKAIHFAKQLQNEFDLDAQVYVIKENIHLRHDSVELNNGIVRPGMVIEVGNNRDD